MAGIRQTVRKAVTIVKRPTRGSDARTAAKSLSPQTTRSVRLISLEKKALVREKQKSSKHEVCKCDTARSEEQKRQSRKFFSGHGSRGLPHHVCRC